MIRSRGTMIKHLRLDGVTNSTLAMWDDYTVEYNYLKITTEEHLPMIKSFFQENGFSYTIFGEDTDVITDWNNLMPLVDKISKHHSENDGSMADEHIHELVQGLFAADKIEVYYGIVRYIKYVNENP